MFLALLACMHSTRYAPDPAPVTGDPWRLRVAPGASGDLARIRQGALHGHAYELLAELTDRVGPRLSGSPALDQAIAWAQRTLTADGVTVKLEPVLVPVWVRGDESLRITAPFERDLAVLGLGGTIGGVVEAPVVVAHSFDDLTDSARGKIVLWNVPMVDETRMVHGYGAAVKYRIQGASRAAEKGAVASLVRSVTTRSLYTPHTGMLRYEDGIALLPSAAVTVEDAELIDRLTQDGTEVRLSLELGAHTLPDALSHNVIGEVRGAVHPDEIVLLAAHIDSWDIDPGANDDGAGVVEVMESLRLLADLPRPPRRTVRGVLFTNEENGLAGAKTYYANHSSEKHVAAIESDVGGGWPLGYGLEDPEQRAWLESVVRPSGLPVLVEDWSGADTHPFEESGILLAGLAVDDRRYFDVHHTRADTVDKVDPEALREATAALAAFALLVANADSVPPRAASKAQTQ
jgi:carboxypeptidase Q